VRWEARRTKKGPLFHLIVRYWELEYDFKLYAGVQKLENITFMYARGAKDNLGYAIAVLMKYRHKTPGCTLDEIGAAVQELNKAKIPEMERNKNHLPVPAGIA